MRTANLAVVFIELDGYAEHAARHSLEESQRLLGRYHQLASPLVAALAGRTLKILGETLLAAFESPTQALLAAVALQDQLWAQNALPSPEAGAHPLVARIGVSLGEVRVERGDVYGEPVNVASRVLGLCPPGEVYFSEAVFLAMNKSEVPSVLVGAFALKGMPEMTRLYRVLRAAGEGEAPFGNLGLARAAELVAVGRTSRVRGFRPVVGAVVVIALVALAIRPLFHSPIDTAIAKVNEAAPRDRPARIQEVNRLIERLSNPSEAEEKRGLLDEVLGAFPRAAGHYTAAARGGRRFARDRLVQLLVSNDCRARSSAAQALAALNETSARGALQRLADNGGEGDGVAVPLFGCNSRSAAAAALRSMSSE